MDLELRGKSIIPEYTATLRLRTTETEVLVDLYDDYLRRSVTAHIPKDIFNQTMQYMLTKEAEKRET